MTVQWILVSTLAIAFLPFLLALALDHSDKGSKGE